MFSVSVENLLFAIKRLFYFLRVDAELAIAVIVAPPCVLPTGTGGGFRLLGGAGAGRLCVLDAVGELGGRLKADGDGGSGASSHELSERSTRSSAEFPLSFRLADEPEARFMPERAAVAVATPPTLSALGRRWFSCGAAVRTTKGAADEGTPRLRFSRLRFDLAFCRDLNDGSEAAPHSEATAPGDDTESCDVAAITSALGLGCLNSPLIPPLL